MIVLYLNIITIILCVLLLFMIYRDRYVEESFFFTVPDNILCSGGLYLHQGNSPQAIHCRNYLKKCEGTCTNRCSDCSCYPKNTVQSFEYNRPIF